MPETSDAKTPADQTPRLTEDHTGTHIKPTQAGITNFPDEESARQEKVIEDPARS